MADGLTPNPGFARELLGRPGKRARDRAAARSLSGSRADEGLEPENPPAAGPADAVAPDAAGAADLRELSLLWPVPGDSHEPPTRSVLSEQTVQDLEIRYLVSDIAPKKRYSPFLDQVLRAPLTDEATIRYRQEITTDILGSPALAQCCRKLAEEAVSTSESFRVAREDHPRLFHVTMRLAELEDFADTVEALHGALKAASGLASQGLRLLEARLDALTATARYASLRSTVHRLLADLRSIRSVTVGINLDSRLRPVEATLVSVNRRRFLGSRFLDTILGNRGEDSHRGIADLHSMLAQRPDSALPIAPPLFRDLAAILDQLGRDIERQLHAFSDTEVAFTTSLKQELVFYASAVNLVERLRSAGLPVCAPVIRPREERGSSFRECYNVNLAFRMLERGADPPQALVRNDALLSAPFRIAVLTGPNNGGKSVFLQALGVAQLLAQAGLPVPAASAELSVADTIVTHYQSEERPDREVGRLHEEAIRLREGLAALSPQSLFLSSETFSSTGSAEAAYLLLDVLRVLQKLGSRAVFSTHLHELADSVERDQAFRSGETQVANLVALFDGRPTYQVVRTSPKGRSYAESIARRLGIQYDQLVESLERSGRFPPQGGA